MGDESVDRAAVHRATQLIEAKHQQIHDLQARLQVQVSTLSTRLPASCSGAFQRSYCQFDSEMEKVKQGLDWVHDSLVETLRDAPHATHDVPSDW